MNHFTREVLDGPEEDAMREVVPLDSPARHGLSEDQSSHLGRVTRAIVAATHAKYADGQVRHGGDLYRKPGMVAHALNEATDLPVYLHTLVEQMLTLVRKCRQHDTTLDEVADEIERWLTK